MFRNFRYELSWTSNRRFKIGLAVASSGIQIFNKEIVTLSKSLRNARKFCKCYLMVEKVATGAKKNHFLSAAEAWGKQRDGSLLSTGKRAEEQAQSNGDVALILRNEAYWRQRSREKWVDEAII